MNKQTDNFSSILSLIFIKRAAFGAIVCGIVVYMATLFIKPLYESEIIVYVPLTILAQQQSQQGIGFGNDREIEWYIQILKSEVLADSLISHLQLRRNNQQNLNNLYKSLESRIQIEKTRYGSVSIKVSDHDPNKAAEMALSIVNLGETIKKDLLYPNRLEAFQYTKNLYGEKASEIAYLEKKLDSLHNSTSKNQLIKNFTYNQTLNNYNLEFQELVSRKNLYERAKKDFDSPLPRVYIISATKPDPKPVWPKRGLLSVLGIGTYLFFLLAIEIIRHDVSKEPI